MMYQPFVKLSDGGPEAIFHNKFNNYERVLQNKETIELMLWQDFYFVVGKSIQYPVKVKINLLR